MAKVPAFQFYPGDWFREPGLRMASLEIKGAWVELLFSMHDAPERGKLSGSLEDFGRLLSIAPWGECVSCEPWQGCEACRREHTALAILRSLIELKICDAEFPDKQSEKIFLHPSSVTFASRVTPRDFFVTLICRRMYREFVASQSHKNRQLKYRKEKKVMPRDAESDAKVTPPSSSSSSSSSSPSKLSSHGGHHQDQVLRGEAGDRLDDFRKNVLSRCEDSDGILATALDIIVDRIRQSGVNVGNPKYLEVALANFDFQQGEDREQLMQRLRRRSPN